MSFLNETEIENLTIERMIFHVVDPALESPTFLAEVKPPQCVDFFVERVFNKKTTIWCLVFG